MKEAFSAFVIATLLSCGAAAATEAVARKTTPEQNVELTQAEVDSLISSVQKCWNPPSDATGKISMNFKLDRSGMVVGAPKAGEEQTGTKQGGLLAAAARRAVLKCQPYILPGQKYESWSEVIINFETE